MINLKTPFGKWIQFSMRSHLIIEHFINKCAYIQEMVINTVETYRGLKTNNY
jgi:hypothetical protein